MRYILDIDKRINSSADLEKNCNLPIYLRFTGKFTEESAVKFRDQLIAAENQAKDSGQEIIPVAIDSYGGSVDGLLSMVDAIQSCSIPIATIVEGKAMSCGAVLLTCGKEGYRFVGPNARVMIHEVSGGAIGKNDEVKTSAQEMDRLNNKIFELMAKNCGHKPNYFKDIVYNVHKNSDWYLTAEECVTHNVANKVGIPTMSVKIGIEMDFGLK